MFVLYEHYIAGNFPTFYFLSLFLYTFAVQKNKIHLKFFDLDYYFKTTAMELSRHGYNHMIVWLDKNIASPGCCYELKKAFATTTNPESNLPTPINEVDINNFICDEKAQRDTTFLDVPFPFKLFDDKEPCLAFLLQNAAKKHIFFITSGALGEHIVPDILNNHRKIFEDDNGNVNKISIYVFCLNMAYHSQWALDYVDLDCIKMENDDRIILACLTRDIANYLESRGKKEFSNDNSASVELALQYFGWAKKLYEQADKVRPAYASDDPLNPLNIINPLIAAAEQKLRDLPTPTIDSDDDMAVGVEN
jgi:hypothetical protein